MSLVRRHLWAFIFAAVIGAACGLPALIAQERMGEMYQGVPVVVSEDELYYLARAHETLDGHPRLGNPYLWEHKETQGLQFWLSDMVLTYVSQALGGLGPAWRVFDFVFPFLIVIISYAIIHWFTRDRLWSLATTAFLIPGLIYHELLRTPHPQLFVLVLLGLLCLLKALEKSNVTWMLLATVLGGSLFYVYPFSWTYFLATLGIALAGCLLLLRHINRTLLITFVGVIVLGIPYVIETLVAARIPYYHESLLRIGVIETHFPSGAYIVSIVGIALLVFAVCWWKRLIPHTPATILIASAALAGAVATNQHIITGLNFFFTGHYELPTTFMVVFVFALCLPALIEKRPRLRIFLVMAAFLFALFSLARQAPELATPTDRDIRTQRYASVLTWLNQETPRDAVVYADPYLSLLIPSFTHNNVLFSTYAQQAYLPQEEVERRYLASRYFDEISHESLIASEFDVFGAYYVGRSQHAHTTNRLRRTLDIPPVEVERYPEADIQRLVEEGSRLKQGSFAEAVAGFRVDYLVWDSDRYPHWQIPQWMKEVHREGDFVVYAVQIQ